MVKAVLPVFWNVIGCDWLVNPVVSVGKKSALSTSSAEGEEATPKPARETVCVPALSVMVTAAVRAPVAAGLKETLKLHTLPLVNVPVQLLLAIVKSAALVPDVATVMPVTDDPELFSTSPN